MQTAQQIKRQIIELERELETRYKIDLDNYSLSIPMTMDNSYTIKGKLYKHDIPRLIEILNKVYADFIEEEGK